MAITEPGARTEAPAGAATREVELAVGGMTCASCAMRIEKRLNRLDGVHATVNYATERARVAFPADVDPATLVGAVEAAGCTATLPADRTMPDGTDGVQGTGGTHGTAAGTVAPDPARALRDGPRPAVRSLAMALAHLAAPVVVWGAWPFHRAAWRNLRHGTATMDTLISVGTLAAFGWSLWALFLGEAGAEGMTMPFRLMVERGAGRDEIYLEVASAVTASILAGRWFEARAKRRSGAALRALLELGAKDVTVRRDGVERRIPVDGLRVDDRFVVRPGEKVATDGVVEGGPTRSWPRWRGSWPTPRTARHRCSASRIACRPCSCPP